MFLRGKRGSLMAAIAIALVMWVPRSGAADHPEDILVIVNKRAPVDFINKDDLVAYFMRTRGFWSGTRDKVVPIHAREGTALRKAFVRRALGMTPAEEDTYWRANQIKEGITSPVAFSNTQKAVFKLKKAVSYVFRSDYKEGVSKVVLILPAR